MQGFLDRSCARSKSEFRSDYTDIVVNVNPNSLRRTLTHPMIANKNSDAAFLPIITTIPMGTKPTPETTLGTCWRAEVITTDEPLFRAFDGYFIASVSRWAAAIATASLSGITAAWITAVPTFGTTCITTANVSI